MCSNNVVNFQESTTILNAYTKKSGNVLNSPRTTGKDTSFSPETNLKKREPRTMLLTITQYQGTKVLLKNPPYQKKVLPTLSVKSRGWGHSGRQNVVQKKERT